MKYIRWRALLPLTVMLLVIALWALVFADRTLKWAVESGGSSTVGARVDVARADLGIRDGMVTLEGLQVTDPTAPMTNLFEVQSLKFNVNYLPALEKKLVIDTVSALGIRFGTPRQVSGAIPREPGDAEQSAALVESFKRQLKVPALELSTLTQSVNVGAISAESLATLREARHAFAYVDTAKTKLIADIEAADPRPTLDSAQALVTRLQSANLRTLGISGARQAVTDVRRTLRDLGQLDDKLRTLETETRGNAAGMQARLAAIPAARAEDYAYARSLLKLPSFEVPSIGPQLFSDLVAEKMAEVVYWLERGQRYVPPGLQRQLQRGRDRVRAAGTDVLFPKERVYPDFLMRMAELSLSIGGESTNAGNYSAQIVGLTSQPAVYGQPTTFRLTRTAGRTGAGDIRMSGFFDHRAAPMRDTIAAQFAGVALPTFPLGGLGGAVVLGTGYSQLTVERRGEAMNGRWLWRAPSVTWKRDSSRTRASDARVAFVEDALWRAIARVDSVEIDARFGGTLRNPTMTIRTNIADAVANALKEQLGEEVRLAEQQVRARVDALVDAEVAKARVAADEAKAQVTERIAVERARLEAQKVALETRLRELTRIPGIG